MNYSYYTCDVFTNTQFGGNPLAVFPNATGLSAVAMQKIAREFNFSESTFVFPAEKGHTHRVRIFTPTMEVPFAGHPNVGTAFVLHSMGETELGSNELIFEEKAGLVPVSIHKVDGNVFYELTAPEELSIGKTVPVADMSKALGLDPSDICIENHAPVEASVGLQFLFVEASDLSVLERAKPILNDCERLQAKGLAPFIHLYCKSPATDKNDDFDIRCRMFAPTDGIFEDPATGSANCALGALLAHLDETKSSGEYSWRIAQGVEMGRPSELKVSVSKDDNRIHQVQVAGQCVLVSKGELYLD